MTAAVLLASPREAGADEAGEAGEAGADEAGEAEEERATERAPRRRDAGWRDVFAGPFPSSRLFGMPTAEVVGAYQISLSGDASLLSESNVLSTSSVVAIGFGDIAQLEYRSSTAVTTLEDAPIRLPSLGVQLKSPFPLPRVLPDLAVALRFGIPRSELAGGVTHEENATDLYVVGRLALGRVTLHGGLRISQAQIDSADSTGEPAPADLDEILLLPAVGVEVQLTEQTRVAAEIARVPLFDPGDASRASDISGGIFSRAGIRWRLLPWLVMDASVGYRIEVERVDSSVGSMANALVDWDMRLGGEIFVPWGAVLCRTSGAFCE